MARSGRQRLITVCSACLRASCWHGEFFCEGHYVAGTVKKTERQLAEINREHPHHYSRENVERICGVTEWTRP